MSHASPVSVMFAVLGASSASGASGSRFPVPGSRFPVGLAVVVDCC